MNISQRIENRVRSLPKGKVFSYQQLPSYAESPTAVIKAINRLVANNKLRRLSKGKFYMPEQGVLGPKTPSEKELLRSILYKNGRVFGYVTGDSLYNQLGLTTQVPRTITIASNGGQQKKEFDTMTIKIITTRIPITENNIKLLQYLDALKDIKRIPDSDINLSLKQLRRYISTLSDVERNRLATLATRYYGAQVKALIAMLYDNLNIPITENLIQSLNPTTCYKLNLDPLIWPTAKEWNIQ